MLYFLESYQDTRTLNPRIKYCISISKSEIVLFVQTNRNNTSLYLPTYFLIVLFFISGCRHPAIFGEADWSWPKRKHAVWSSHVRHRHHWENGQDFRYSPAGCHRQGEFLIFDNNHRYIPRTFENSQLEIVKNISMILNV